MIHCPHFLYHNLLFSNIENLQNLFMVGISFYGYLNIYETKCQKDLTLVEEASKFEISQENHLDFGLKETFFQLI
jgi:hypothetical protein